MKKLILVVSPPACGKTYISKKIAQKIKCVYLDKDTLIPLSKQIFKVAGEENNRSSDFFEENIRNVEYEVIIDLAIEALDYADIALINAPFSREIRNHEYMTRFKKQLSDKGIELVVVWVETSKEVCHARMIERNSDRDTWKLAHWDEYISKQNFNKPDIENLIIFKNSNEAEFENSLNNISKKILK